MAIEFDAARYLVPHLLAKSNSGYSSIERSRGGCCMQPKSERKDDQTKGKGPDRSDSNVPEMAENMEHTLRRLGREKNKARAMSPVK